MSRGDIPTVLSIDRLSFPNPWPASAYMYELSNNRRSFYYVLQAGVPDSASQTQRGCRNWLDRVLGRTPRNGVIGYLGVRLRNQRAHISTIAIHPDWRGRHLGELLLMVAIQKALKLETGAVTLEVRASNQIAQKMYLKYGFHFVGIQEGYYQDGEDAWLMIAKIEDDAYRARLRTLRQALEARLVFLTEFRTDTEAKTP
jgi:ribosomal-protein-alanine N-acetyltransferase